LFRVYVDEAGDRGWGGRSSPVFVVSAVIVSDDEDAELRRSLDSINRDFGRDPKSVLHWARGARLELVAVFEDEDRRVPIHLGKDAAA
jgi:hypothetical protein